MAIQINQEPTPFYPSYNNSFLKFQTNFLVDNRAVITLDGKYQFSIFPDVDGNYLFNMREVVKALINPNQFRDNVDFSGSSWIYSDSSLYRKLPIEIVTYGTGSEGSNEITLTSPTDGATFTEGGTISITADIQTGSDFIITSPNAGATYSEGETITITTSTPQTSSGTADEYSQTVNATYTFTKAVKQFGDQQHSNPYQLMLPSKDGLNYPITYFEGYPLDITFRYVNSGDRIQLKNRRTGKVTDGFTASQSAPLRLFLDKAFTNLAIDDIFPLTDAVNPIDVLVNGAVVTSLDIRKRKNSCGKYLKWFNADGSYSYWLFDQWYKQDHQGSEIDRVSTNNFNNIYGNPEGLTKITGKSGGSSLKLKTIVTEYEKDHLVSLITSPSVSMWSAEEPYQHGEWIDVKLTSRGFTYSNKRAKNQIEVEIELPEINTQTL